MFIPKLYIKYAYPLDTNRRNLFVNKNLGPYPSMEEVRNKTEEWKNIWSDINKDDVVFKSLINITGVNIPRDLELFVFGAGLGAAMSSPLIMPVSWNGTDLIGKDDFIDTVIHEIIHRFVGDSENNIGIIKYFEAIRREYPDEAISIHNHIIIYAVLDKILPEIIGVERLKEIRYKGHKAYQRAIDIVLEKGSDNLINQFRSYLE